ncbi:MAG: hypothetical protein IJW51_06845 [Clostridia bacterium]|nr:hypothetical protein [Clostridia bacterium]
MATDCNDGYGALAHIAEQAQAYCGVQGSILTRSILGREIPVFTLGQGKKAVVFIGGIGGGEALISMLLFDFIKDYSEQYKKRSKIFDIGLPYLFGERRIVVIPMLNPDGISYATEGVTAENPLFERVCRMNGSEDFSDWQANARGVDLGHNYRVGFASVKALEQKNGVIGGGPHGFGGEYPESEPESAAICRLLHGYGEDLQGLIELRLGAAQITCSCRDKLSAKTMAAGRILGRAMGFRDPTPVMTVPSGTLPDWCIENLSRPAYTLSLDAEKHSHQKARTLFYDTLRRPLFTFPFML